MPDPSFHYTGPPLYIAAAAESLAVHDPATLDRARRLEPLRRISDLLAQVVEGPARRPPIPPEAMQATLDHCHEHIQTLLVGLAASVLAYGSVAGAVGLPGIAWPLSAPPPDGYDLPPARAYRKPPRRAAAAAPDHED